MSGLKIDGRPIRVEMDWGFSDGRQYGRAVDGGQMRYYINDIKNSAKGGHRKRSDYSHEDRRDNGYRETGDGSDTTVRTRITVAAIGTTPTTTREDETIISVLCMPFVCLKARCSPSLNRLSRP